MGMVGLVAGYFGWGFLAADQSALVRDLSRVLVKKAPKEQRTKQH